MAVSTPRSHSVHCRTDQAHLPYGKPRGRQNGTGHAGKDLVEEASPPCRSFRDSFFFPISGMGGQKLDKVCSCSRSHHGAGISRTARLLLPGRGAAPEVEELLVGCKSSRGAGESGGGRRGARPPPSLDLRKGRCGVWMNRSAFKTQT